MLVDFRLRGASSSSTTTCDLIDREPPDLSVDPGVGCLLRRSDSAGIPQEITGQVAREWVGGPPVHAVDPERRGSPRIPFVGLIGAYVLRFCASFTSRCPTFGVPLTSFAASSTIRVRWLASASQQMVWERARRWRGSRARSRPPDRDSGDRTAVFTW
jgi:hypothetical protein